MDKARQVATLGEKHALRTHEAATDEEAKDAISKQRDEGAVMRVRVAESKKYQEEVGSGKQKKKKEVEKRGNQKSSDILHKCHAMTAFPNGTRRKLYSSHVIFELELEHSWIF